MEAQEKRDRKKFDFVGIVAVGQSYFDVTIKATEFKTLEYRVGIGIIKSIKRFGIRSGLLIGLKDKRPSYQNGLFYSQPGYPLPWLDETTSKRRHLFLEVPFNLKLNLTRHLVVRGGVTGRLWAHYDYPSYDILSSKKELGIIGGAGYRIKRISVYYDLFAGLTQVWGGSIANNTQYKYYSVRNRYAQIVLEYKI